MYKKNIIISALAFLIVFFIDQLIKRAFTDGFHASYGCISFKYTLNSGIAFSLFSFARDYLKFIVLAVLIFIVLYVFKKRDIFVKYYLPIGIFIGAGSSNLYDRFLYNGVVDYIHWKCLFDFAIFNFADIMINLSIVVALFIYFSKDRAKKIKNFL